ncbi:MAG TPA: sigma factor [Solirubrobacteraceae bacterium]|jgi:RNA polymerase sigma-70 factor (ECF subfamily)
MTRRPIDPGDALGPLAAAGVDEERAVGELIACHRADLGLYCYLMLGCPDKADAAVQVTLARARRGLGGADPVTATRTWLYRIATHACHEESERGR